MIAIILVNYNGAADTIDCLRSLSKITKFNEPILKIVVDNKSTDQSVSQLASLQEELEFVLLCAKENKGFSAGNNLGIKYAIEKGADFFLLLNNDTVVDPNFLISLKRAFSFSKNCGASTGKILYYSEPTKIWYAGGSLNNISGKTVHCHFDDFDSQSDEKASCVSFASGCCMLLSKDLINHIGLLNEKYFLYEEDVDFCYRITSSGYEIVYDPTAIIYHKVSSSTGRNSVMSQYYLVRNKFIFLKDSFRGKNVVSAFVFCLAQMAFRCLKGQLNVLIFFKALVAFCCGESGKVDRKI